MSLRYIYSPSVGISQEITAFCRLYRYSATTDAKEGSVAHSTLIVDDPNGELSFTGHRRLYTYETLANPSNLLVHNGYTFREQVSRGPYRTGSGRIWTLDIADNNVLMNRRVMNGTDANRPAETDVERMEALMGIGGTPMAELSNVEDTLYFSGVDPVDMDAVDYRTQFPGPGYIDDCAQASGKNYFVWYREATGEDSLWYDFASSSNWSSAIRLSNVLADVDDVTTFAVDLETEAELDRDPSRVASGVMLPFDGVAVGSNTVSGTVYVQNQDTADEFTSIDWVAPSINVKTQAKALARANRYLADLDEEDDLIHCSVKLPAANVNDIYAGMRVEAKFSHFPGYEDFTWMRCLSRTVNEISEDPTRAYRLDLELSPHPSETVQATLYRARSDGRSEGGLLAPDDISWVTTGDDAGIEIDEPEIDTIGPITFIPGETPILGWGNWLGMEFGGTGELVFNAEFVLYGAELGGQTFTVELLKNGITEATYSCVCGTDCIGFDGTTLHIDDTVTVEPGDQLTWTHTTGGDYVDKQSWNVTSGTLS